MRFPRATHLLILCKTREEAEAALEVAAQLLDRLKLRLSPEKTVISSFQEGFDLLGFHFTARHVGVGKKSLKGMYVKVHEMTRRQQGDIPAGHREGQSDRRRLGQLSPRGR